MVPVELLPDAGMVVVLDCVVDGMVEGVVVFMPEDGGVMGVVDWVVEGGRTVPGPAVPWPVVPVLPLPPGVVGVVVCAKARPLARTMARPQAVDVAVRMMDWDMLAPDVKDSSTSVARTEYSVCG
jgi:hypothetical protein